MISNRRYVRQAALALPLACSIACSIARSAEAVPDPILPTALPPVEITGTATVVDGRDSTASRSVVTREDIARYGDSSVTDVLRRVPGITVTGAQGRASDIRMRGLGSGYTQILINGEAVPGGFSLESLSPGQVERIEIARVATVDVGAQAIAGTINIILRQAMRKGQREVKASASSNAGRASALLDGQFSDRFDGFSYSLGTGFSRKNEVWPSTIAQQGSDASGAPELERVTRRRAYGLAESVSLTPKFSPQWGENDKVSLEALLRHTRFNDHSDDQRESTLGPLPLYSSDTQELDLRTTLTQGRLNWTHTLAGGATVDTRLGANFLRRASSTLFQGQDEHQDLAMDEHVTSATTERGFTAAGKFRLPYSEGHAIALGWDGEQTRRDESRSQRQSSAIGRPVVDLDESYRTAIQRLALFAQDEWDWDEALSAYAGVRWATLRTRTEGMGLAPVGNRSAVFSPVVQVLWKPPEIPGDRVRFALSRTYKAPRAVDLIPRRFVAIENTPTTPNLQGNPDLRPELAWGIDMAYEHALAGKTGAVNVSASTRRIRDVILDRLTLDNGAWVSSKANQGSASVFGLEVDSRLSLRAAWPDAPDMDIRASVSRNWSTVDQVPGPDNRLDSQIPLSANLGVDWRVADVPLTVGGSLAYRGSMRARTSLTQTTSSNPLRTLDLYALWKFSAAAQLRIAISNALGPHDISTEAYLDASGGFRQTTDAPAEPTFRVGLELKF
jgi:outer membrane receptor for ferrienterochelin and colicin